MSLLRWLYNMTFFVKQQHFLFIILIMERPQAVTTNVFKRAHWYCIYLRFVFQLDLQLLQKSNQHLLTNQVCELALKGAVISCYCLCPLEITRQVPRWWDKCSHSKLWALRLYHTFHPGPQPLLLTPVLVRVSVWVHTGRRWLSVCLCWGAEVPGYEDL